MDGDELIDHDGRTILASGAQFSSAVDGAIIDADGGRLIFRPARKTLTRDSRVTATTQPEAAEAMDAIRLASARARSLSLVTSWRTWRPSSETSACSSWPCSSDSYRPWRMSPSIAERDVVFLS